MCDWTACFKAIPNLCCPQAFPSDKIDWGKVFSIVPVFLTNQLSKHATPESLFAELMNPDHTGEQLFRGKSKEELEDLLQGNTTVDLRLKEMRLSTRIILAGAIVACQRHTPPGAEDILAPKAQVAWDTSNTYENPDLGLLLPCEDEQSSSKGGKSKGDNAATVAVMKAVTHLPIVDFFSDSLEFKSVEEGIIFGQSLLGPILPVPRYAWSELASDAAQANLAYYGLGQLHLSMSDDPSRGEHMIDMRAMASLKVREPFEKYGAAAYFSNGSITGIDWSAEERFVLPGEPEWEHVKFAWRASYMTWVTAIDHLVTCHLIVSNAIGTSIRECLPCDHPVRRVLHVNTFGASKTNTGANFTLAYAHGFLQRMSSLEWEGGLDTVLRLGADSFKFETWPDRVRASNLPDHLKSHLPLFVDGLDVWNALHAFYEEYVDVYYKNDAAVCADQALASYWSFRCSPQYTQGLPTLSKAALVDQLTHACFGVTAYHQVAGDVVQYVTTPRGLFFQIRPGQEMVGAEEFVNVMALTASTGREMPLLTQDWSHLLEPSCKPAWQRLMAALQDVSARIAQRNSLRPVPYTEMDPACFECSVSI